MKITSDIIKRYDDKPGNYLCKCINCGRGFTGDKRDMSCGQCETPDTQEFKIALMELCEALRMVHGDGAYRAVWELSQIHIGPYVGPTYTKEYKAARTLLGLPNYD